jgi:glutamyl-tRNA(Gln) amidotransferase subunit E
MTDFKFKPFEEMTPDDYETIGFKSGLEIHQQIYTAKKLFCRCPAGKYSHVVNAEILRHMRPTLSELGEYDGTALMEFKTRKEIVYQINRDTVCTYEMDDTPPFEINEEALEKAIGIGMMLKCNMIDEIHIARKQYLDGSIPTGFQRTTIFGVDGEIPYKDRKIHIVQISLEEDSCREVSDIGHTRVYNTDRLGMPLIETVTAPEMKTPYEVMEVGERLSALVKSTGLGRTGAGAAREDVNVSVTGGTRIEIKGVPSLKRIPKLTYNEAMRQWNLLRIKDELEKRGITKETIEIKKDIVTKVLKKATYKPIKDAINEQKIVGCVTLRGFKDLLRRQTQTDTFFSKEFSDRVRVIACLNTLPNIIHSDSTGETIYVSEWQAVKKFAGAKENDTIVLVWGDEKDVETAMNEIANRAVDATLGVPSETRQAMKDGTTGFERILPGPERMYPDTDLPPKKINRDRFDEIRKTLPEYYWEREAWYESLNLPDDVIGPLAISKYANLFKKIVTELKADAVTASVALIQYPKRLKKKRLNPDNISEEDIYEIFKKYKSGEIAREGILILMEAAASGNKNFDEVIGKPLNEKEMTKVFEETEYELNHKRISKSAMIREVILGESMHKVRGRYAGSKASQLLNQKMELKNV